MSPRFVSVGEAVGAIEDGATVATDGFTMMGVAEAIFSGIAKSFLDLGHPRDLTLVHASGQSDGHGGFEHFAHEGLVHRVVGSHWGLMPAMSQFLGKDIAEGVCLPQGQISTLYRAIAAGRPGNLSKVGLGTFVDPRNGGGKINDSARRASPDYVRLIQLDEEEFLLYCSFPINVAIIRATSVDSSGNCSQEEEAAKLDALTLAQAAHNSGGIVICQAKQLVSDESLQPRDVTIPACLIDYVVLAPNPDIDHRQTHSTLFDAGFISRRTRRSSAPVAVDEERMKIGRIAARFVREGDVINLGTGIPGDSVGPALVESGLLDSVTLTVESGVYQGVPVGGLDFGIALGPTAIIPHASQFDFYDGGGLDATFMGAGQVDQYGNVNVSLLGSRVIGCGGFIDIVQGARRVHFCFNFGGRHPKFVQDVSHLTFSAERAFVNGQEVFYVTERASFQLVANGLRLIEVQPGFDIQADILSQIPFPVEVSDALERSRSVVDGDHEVEDALTSSGSKEMQSEEQ